MEKEKIHFSWRPHSLLPACSADRMATWPGRLKITNIRKYVTCKNCMRTKRFKEKGK